MAIQRNFGEDDDPVFLLRCLSGLQALKEVVSPVGMLIKVSNNKKVIS